MASSAPRSIGPRGLSRDFWLYWSGQLISQMGSSITAVVLPLLVFTISNSPLDLGIAAALDIVPYLIFGLFIGAWVDRLDRKKIMILADVGRTLVIVIIPLAAIFHVLSVGLIYVLIFFHTVLRIWFESGQFAIIPNLVEKDKLVEANGYIQASFSTANALAPFLGGIIILLMPVHLFLFIDAASFLVSAGTLFFIATSFKLDYKPERKNILADVKEGLVYVFTHPVLRNIAIMLILVNIFGASREAQIVTLATVQFHASPTEIIWLATAANIGIIVLSLSAGFLRKRFPFGVLALGTLMIHGALTLAISFVTSYWIALPLWALVQGTLILFNMNNGALRQAIVPSHLLGRVVSVAFVTAWSTIPLGRIAGGFVIEKTGNVSLIYALIGITSIIIPAIFFLTPLGRADHYIELRKKEEEEQAKAREEQEIAQESAEVKLLEELELESEFPAEAGTVRSIVEKS